MRYVLHCLPLTLLRGYISNVRSGLTSKLVKSSIVYVYNKHISYAEVEVELTPFLTFQNVTK